MGAIGFLSRLQPRGFGSRDVAKERLRLTLVNDRAGVAPHLLEKVRADMIEAASKYLEIDGSAVTFTLSNSDASVALVANMPVRRIKRASEIDGAARS
ncbi:MAG: cell division topological specificity factor MinE [Ignavibacteriales bacterium]